MWIIVSQGSKTLISFQYGGQFLNGQYYFLFNTYVTTLKCCLCVEGLLATLIFCCHSETISIDAKFLIIQNV